ncbi:RNA polymerase sigma factor [Paenibacillus aurantius]|uniref:RNA polymerase sigma factor n=1 Tax=Paenibacillus aurantius TaxID=2918900 RepID=A0AA96RE38_9BACL|nr:RNA polymerase sigma factor [Paenibacillus aurantius]WNQ10091.1 RNA polymerase sigma factor [Paenibacillus aurantius]
MMLSDQEFELFRVNIHSLNHEAQRRLFLAYRQWVYRDIYFLLNDHALTEDCIQETFMKAVRSGPKTRSDSRMGAWLKKLARNGAYDFLRKLKKYRQMSGLDDVIDKEEAFYSLPVEKVEDMVERMQRNEILHATIQELKPDYRVVLFLHYIAELSYSEISAELGITEQVLTQRLARARKKLAGHFIRKWGDDR